MTTLYELRKDYHLGVITNGPSTSQWEKIDRLKLREHFDIILVSGDLPWEKPNRMIFQEACLYLGVEPDQCIMIGDKLETDILGAIHAKLGYTVWIPLNNNQVVNCHRYHNNSKGIVGRELLNDKMIALPDFIVEHVKQLPNLLLTINDVNKEKSTNSSLPSSSSSSSSITTTIRLIDDNKPDLNDHNSNGSDGS